MDEADPDRDVPPEYRRDFDRAREVAQANESRHLTDDPHSARAWAMDPRHRNVWARGLGGAPSRFEEPLRSAKTRVILTGLGGAALTAAGGLDVGLAVDERAGLSAVVLIAALVVGTVLLAFGVSYLWWTVRRGPKWADRELLTEFE
jgi:hypothetical protein